MRCYGRNFTKDNQSGGRMNNFEKIKNMTIDEMAEWLEYFVYAYTSGNICYEDAKEILLESEG